MAVPENRQPLIATLKKAAFHLKETGIPFCLAGSFAVYARGGESVDHDIDFLIKEADAERVMTGLGEVGFRCEVPPEGWLVKAWDQTEDGDLLIDFIFCPVQRPVTDATLTDTDVIAVNACHMPVLSATELMIHKVLTWSAHYCDFARGLPVARSLREQIDWPRVFRETAHSPYAHAFLFLIDRLGVMSLSEASALSAAV
ncbi:nucleotidyltransferase family protein [Dactylosporangium roseum]|uniref:Nucleotidyltransferase family protein n=1 Tax=Dactylosporangium roseum TaxID=47989 RepID=A0ABY5Z2W9_9ACTN|nr:nucleotidyltransferase family protein [Dactylosporangium roseum]UWZ35428.1 nucleotidyltransferase family protein [Dactylosporangium roseum]